ncbi:hypothetical protein M9H77_11826 [Catharanthus roseus]|uniref:Uncharacterized protein n=1 Tax=Catharanthus roseus TaxID=4058 RepID=A0ACC0BFR4_CATRO|nr:hypothetical protein M9H77_11826 [Catharanthus roseus]
MSLYLSLYPIRVVLFWDSKYARDAYGPYFTGAVKKTWTFTRMVTHDQLVRKILKHQGMDPNLWRVLTTMRVPLLYEEYQMFNITLYSMNNNNDMRYFWTIRLDISKEGIHILVEFEPIQSQTFSDVQHTHIVSDEPSILYPNVEEDDEDDDDANEAYDVSSASGNANYTNDEEDDISTLINPLYSITVNQWQSSQWFSNAPHDYTSSGAFLDMGSREQIDDLIESGTIRLLNWNDAMTDLQLGMRFFDKIRSISAVQKWSIWTGGEFRVVKSSSKQALKYGFKIYFKTNIASCCQRSLSRTSSKKCKYYFRRVVCARWHVVANGKNIHCLVLTLLQSVKIMVQDQILMCQTYIHKKLIDEHTNPTFIWLGMRTFGEMLLTI